MVFGIGRKSKKASNKRETKETPKASTPEEDTFGDLFKTFAANQDQAENGDTPKDGNKEKNTALKGHKDGESEKEGEKVGNGGGVLEDVDEACTLSWKARLIGFGVCFFASLLMIGLGYLFIVLHKIPAFAVVYSIGSLTAILSTGFLVGPMRQFKVMMEKGRVVATIIYLAAIVITIVVGVKKMLIPAILCMILQVVAFIFYSLTFMPFVGRYLKRKCSVPKI
jgi:hypothetical protein